MGLLIFLAIALTSAVLWHRFLPRYTTASLGATITTVLAFQAAAFLQLGYLDPYFLIAVITSSVAALVISLVVGLPLRARRKQAAQGRTNAL